MSRHTRTRVRNLCGCGKCLAPSGLLHGTAERAERCTCRYCTAAATTLDRLTAYTRTDACQVPVLGAGPCTRPAGHPLPHVAEQSRKEHR